MQDQEARRDVGGRLSNAGRLATLAALAAVVAVATTLAWTGVAGADQRGTEITEDTTLEKKVVEVAPGEKPADDELVRRVQQFRKKYDMLDQRVRVTAVPTLNMNNGKMMMVVTEVAGLDEKDRLHNVVGSWSNWWTRRADVMPYEHGVRHGTELQHAGTRGYLAAEVPWVKGVRHGVRKAYYSDGSLMTETRYVKGEITGKSKSYDQEGNLTRTLEYKDGQKHGERLDYWPENGNVKRRVQYKNGQAVGEAIEYHLNGELKRKFTIRNGRMHGREVLYNDEGELIRKRFWLDGDPVSESKFKSAQGETNAAAKTEKG
jgi:antitoxin component YwqK of YwqJK toxin-antitoxin module